MFFEKIYWFYLRTSLQFWVKKIVNATKHNAFIINHHVPLIQKFLSLTLLICIAETVGSTHLWTLLFVLAHQKLSTMTFSVVWVLLWQKNAEFFNFAPEFIICGALCIKYQFKSPFSLTLLWLHACGRHHWIWHVKYYQLALF